MGMWGRYFDWYHFRPPGTFPAIRINVFILGHNRSRFLDNGSINFKKVNNFGKGDSTATSFICDALDIFLLPYYEMGLKRTNRRLSITQMADLDVLENF